MWARSREKCACTDSVAHIKPIKLDLLLALLAMADSKEDYLTLKTTTELYVFGACGVFAIRPARLLPIAPCGLRPRRLSPPLLCRLPRSTTGHPSVFAASAV